MREINVKPKNILLEPIGKNTGPAIALASLKALENNNDPVLIILSSDHKIDNLNGFHKVIEDGVMKANEGRIVTFGIIPDSPETGYGYIESYEEISANNPSSRIKKFVEKPNIELAKKFIKTKIIYGTAGSSCVRPL